MGFALLRKGQVRARNNMDLPRNGSSCQFTANGAHRKPFFENGKQTLSFSIAAVKISKTREWGTWNRSN
jgi:hypothetical protein